MANGELIIDNKLLKAIDTLEKKLQKVSTSSRTASVDIRNMFAKTTPQGIDTLIKKLQNLEKYYQNIGANESKGMKRIAKQAKNAADEINKVIQSLRATQSTNYGSAMRFSSMAKNLAQDREAINRLKQARENLSRTDSEYNKKLNNINNAILTHRQRITSATRGTEELSRAHRGLFNTSDQLTTKLALVFSVSQVQGYMSKIVAVRKEFELQQKALSAIIGDQDKANELWNQTVSLAVKSPFRVKELVTYTKQLAAYRIETDQLHDTTKRLADVSAGLGVDMNRLILAYGQVRAANFLRGTELRQFTEAGIPMLDELAKHFSDLEGRAVSAGDVFERVSKRMVMFKDVETVFENMANKGGVFFNMQEKQSQTLYGMISNLHDTLDLMMNDIGKSNDEVLKNAISVAKTVAENWRVVAVVLKEVAASYALLKVAQLYKGIRMVAAGHVFLAAQMKGAVGVAGKLTLAFKKLGATIKAHPIMMILGALASAGYALWEYNDAIDEANKKYDELSEKEVRRMRQLEDMSSEVEKNNNVLKDSNKSEEEKNNALKANEEILRKLKNEYPLLTNSIRIQRDGTIDLTNAVEKHNMALRSNILLQQQAKGGFFQQDLGKNYGQALEALTKLEKEYYLSIGKAEESLYKLEVNKDKFTESQYDKLQGYLKNISRASDYKESVKYIKELNEYIRDNQSTLRSLGKMRSLTSDIFGGFINTSDLEDALSVYNESVEDIFDNLNNSMDTFEVSIKKIKKEGKEAGKTEDEVKLDIGSYIDESLKQLNILDKNIRDRARKYIATQLKVKVTFVDPEDEEKELEDWAKRTSEAVKKINEKIRKENKSIPDRFLLPLPTENDTKESYMNIAKSRIEDIKKTYLKDQKIIDEEEAKIFDSLKPYVKEFENILNITDKTPSRDKGKDWFSEMAKSIRDTHKEFVTLHQDLDKTAALEEAIKKNEDAFLEASNQAGLDLTLRDFVDLDFEGGAIGALLDFLEYIPESAKNARLNVNKFIGELTGEDTVNKAKRVFSELQSSFENMFGEYELTLNLKEAGFNSDWIESFFNVPNTTLEDIRAKIRNTLGTAAQGIEDDKSLKEAIQNSSLPENVQKELIKNLEKVSEEERKALQKRLEQYLEYSKKSLTAVSQIRLKEAQELQSVNETISAEIERVGKDTEKGKKLAEVLDTLRKSIKDTAQRDVISAEWDEFKSSESFIQFFEDAEFATTKSINNMLEQLEEFRKGLVQENDVELMRAVVKEMEKLGKIKLERAPFMAIINTFKDLKDYRDKRSDYELFGLDIYGVENKSGFKSNKDIDNSISQINDAIEGLRKKYKEAVSSGDSVVATSLDDDIKKLKEGKKGLEDLKSEGADAGKTLRKSFSAFGGKLTEIGQSLPQFQAAFENMGIGFSQGMKDAIATTSEVLTGVGSAIQGFASGNYLQGVLGVVSAIGSLFQIGDKKKERDIQEQIKLVKKLGKQYEELEQKINDAYSINTLKASYDQAQANLSRQIAAYEKMIASEEAKKKRDKERIEEWQDEQKELMRQQEELMKSEVEKFGGNYDFRSVAKDFVDAWIDAFRETGNGIDGLDEKFKNLMNNIVVEQAVMKGASTILSDLLNKINSSLEGDFSLDEDELKGIEKLNEYARLRLHEFLKSLFGEGGIYSDYVNQDNAGELSGLQRGIQGVTEETAHIIEGYLNSIRFFVSEKYRVLSEFVSSFSNPEMENPLVAQLRIIATQTSNIHDLLNSLTAPHPTLDGRGLKVVM